MQFTKNIALKKNNTDKLSGFPLNQLGEIVAYDDEQLTMPQKIIEMGLLPSTSFKILYKAPFGGPLYIEFGAEKRHIALRVEEANYIEVKAITV